MDKVEKQLEKYKIAVEQTRFEGEVLWQIMNTFMLANTVLIGFIATTLDHDFRPFREFKPVYFIIGVAGLMISLAWLGTFIRNGNFYRFRMEQAKEIEPSDFAMLNGRGEDFAEGGRVKIGETTHHNRCFANFMKNKRAGYIIIWAFVCMYFLLAISSVRFCGR